MNSTIKHICWVLAFTLVLLGACKKEEISTNALSPTNITIQSDANVKWALGAVSGNGFVLLVYANTYGEYVFKLIDNEGSEIWKKNFGYTYSTKNSQLPNLEILYDVDETFAIFQGNSLKKINMQGDIVLNDSNFLKGINFSNVSISDIVLGNNNNYLILGSIQLSGSRAFVGEYSRNGQQNFYKIYTINVSSSTFYSSGFKNENGGYTIAGSFYANTVGPKSAFFISTLDANGTMLKTIKTEVDSFNCFGKELIKLTDGNLGYLLSNANVTSTDNRSRLYKLNSEGEVMGIQYLDLASINIGAGGNPFIGKGLVLNSDGTFAGLMKSNSEIQTSSTNSLTPTYIKPHYGYCYILDQNANVISQQYLNKNYSNYYNAIVQMSNGKTLLFGTTLSFGEEMKLTTLVL